MRIVEAPNLKINKAIYVDTGIGELSTPYIQKHENQRWSQERGPQKRNSR